MNTLFFSAFIIFMPPRLADSSPRNFSPYRVERLNSSFTCESYPVFFLPSFSVAHFFILHRLQTFFFHPNPRLRVSSIFPCHSTIFFHILYILFFHLPREPRGAVVRGLKITRKWKVPTAGTKRYRTRFRIRQR